MVEPSVIEEDIVQVKRNLNQRMLKAVRAGAMTNLDRHIKNMSGFGVPVIVSINLLRILTKITALRDVAHASGASVCVTEVHAKGGEGGEDLAKAVVKLLQDHVAAGRPFTPLFVNDAPIIDKSEKRLQLGCIKPKMYILKQKQISNYSRLILGAMDTCRYVWPRHNTLSACWKIRCSSGFTLPVRELIKCWSQLYCCSIR